MMLPDFSKNFANQPSPASPTPGDVKSAVQREKVMPQQEEEPVKKIDVRYILAVLLLTFAIISTGGMFGFNAYLDREIVAIESGIETLEEVIKINDILDLATFDKQIGTLKDLTVSRGGYSLLLAEVSRLVIPGVHYSSVSIATSDEGYTVIVKGIASSLAQYHQQIQQVEASEGLLANSNFDGYSLQYAENGATTVLFTVSFLVDAVEVSEILNTIS